MTVNIPVNLGPPAASAAGGGPLTLPLGIGGAVSKLASAVGSREARALRAVAAAAPIARPRRALEVAKEAREDPGASFGKAAEIDLKPVLEKVVQAQQDRSGAPTPTGIERAVAREVGADPVLVAAASSVVKGSDAAADASLYWVASVNLDLYERATRAAVRESLLDTIPPQQSQARLDEIEARVTSLDTAVAGIDTTVKTIDTTLKSIDTRVTDLNTRVERLEGGMQQTKSTRK